jgi:hypothetical protein
MSYGAHIKRVRTQTSQGITLEEWIAYVRSDKEMRHLGEAVIKRSSSEWPRRWVRLFRVTRANPTANQEALAPADGSPYRDRQSRWLRCQHGLSLGHGRRRTSPLRPPLVPQPARSARRAERLSSAGCCIGAPNTSAAIRLRERLGARKHQTLWAC